MNMYLELFYKILYYIWKKKKVKQKNLIKFTIIHKQLIKLSKYFPAEKNQKVRLSHKNIETIKLK